MVGLSLALFNTVNISLYKIVYSADLLIDLTKGIVTDDGEVSQPKYKTEEQVVLLFRDEVVPTVHGLIDCISLIGGLQSVVLPPLIE